MIWDLYNHSRDPMTRKAVAAAKVDLNAALALAKKAVKRGMKAADAMDIFMYPVMNVHADAGASDTEPREQAWEVLIAAKKAA